MATRRIGWAMVLSAVATAMVVNALVLGQQPATLTPTVVAPLPVSLTGLASTSVTAGTVATTSGIVPPLIIPTSVLTMARQAPNDWNVVLAVTSASGIGTFLAISENLVVSLGAQSLSLTSGTSYPVTTSAVTLGASGLTLTLLSSSAVGCHSCAVSAELRITPTSGSLPSFVYPWSITTAA